MPHGHGQRDAPRPDHRAQERVRRPPSTRPRRRTGPVDDWLAEVVAQTSTPTPEEKPPPPTRRLAGITAFVYCCLVVLLAFVAASAVEFEFLNAVQAWAKLPPALAMAALLGVVVLCVASPEIRRRVFARARLAGGMLAALVLSAAALVMLDAADSPDGHSRSTAEKEGTDRGSAFALSHLALPSAAHARGLVQISGEVFQWGGRRVTGRDGTRLIETPAAIEDVAPCGGGVIVAFGRGFVARYSVRDGRAIAQPRQLASEAVRVACTRGAALVTLPEAKVAVVAELDGAMSERARIPLGGTPSSLLARSERLAMVGDAEHGRVVSVDLATNTLTHAAVGVPEPSRLVAHVAGAIAVEPQRGCLRRISEPAGRADRVGVAVTPPITAVARSGDSLLVVGANGTQMQRFDRLTLGARPVVEVPRGYRISDATGDRVGWTLLAPKAQRLVLVTPGQLLAMERRRGRTAAAPPCL